MSEHKKAILSKLAQSNSEKVTTVYLHEFNTPQFTFSRDKKAPLKLHKLHL